LCTYAAVAHLTLRTRELGDASQAYSCLCVTTVCHFALVIIGDNEAQDGDCEVKFYEIYNVMSMEFVLNLPVSGKCLFNTFISEYLTAAFSSNAGLP
jgi:hypothetical protein